MVIWTFNKGPRNNSDCPLKYATAVVLYVAKVRPVLKVLFEMSKQVSFISNISIWSFCCVRGVHIPDIICPSRNAFQPRIKVHA